MQPKDMFFSNESSYLLALHRAFYSQHLLLQRLLRQYGSAMEVFAAAAEITAIGQVSRQVATALANPDWLGVEKDLEWLASSADNFVVALSGSIYPPLLQQIQDPPAVLFGCGRREALYSRQVAIVGSRRASVGGRRRAAHLAAELSHSGVAVTSGLAVGIDGSAHESVVSAKGVAVAVLGSGIDNIYPRCHCTLAKRITQSGGVVVSEFATGLKPLPKHFPRRNRIISGLGSAVVVIEADLDSGSLITARLAAEQGREVLAMPGSPDNPLSRGCHSLLRDGAGLVESAGDVLDALGLERPQGVVKPSRSKSRAAHERLPPQLRKLLLEVDYHSTSVETLAERCGLTVAKVSSMLFALEGGGHVALQLDGSYCRIN
ncbi:MAG: DNA-processing protein DprA [Candidatus Porifericomitaceae bacterium WSBS_2022_MAG_OTU9]